ncbi:UNVERIFIED_CONTAM: Retrovirus-related Pol polyprotein from transposon RE2 [Sesamum radiatum]|uniref:Retrovirus-related Pol polyprotein from transposon RE2 n=1 Tax=Sesamum radiatum TaxID=300843 RepID=A0AAW2KA66_SESRA
MSSNKVWTFIDPPKGVKLVVCKWIHKRKLGADGEVTTFKTGLVAKGYTQRPGVDYEETYSPVAMAKSIRIMLSIVTWYDYEIQQMDLKTTFLNGFVEEPKGFTSIGEEQKVCHLKMSIYGLKGWQMGGLGRVQIGWVQIYGLKMGWVVDGSVVQSISP